MTTQSYSTENFLDIYDLENRRGKNFDKDFFPEVHRRNLRIDRKSRAIRNFYKKHSKSGKLISQDKKRLQTLYSNVNKEKKLKRDALTQALNVVSAQVSERSFSISLTTRLIKGRTVYVHGDTAPEYFSLKQTANNIRSVYKVKQADRNSICAQIRNLISDGYCYKIVRTDIQSFYESIPHNAILKRIDNDSLLSAKTKSTIKEVLRHYASLNGGVAIGLPRGVNISADLSEMFMRHIDDRIKYLNGVCFYARYVDDIIVFFAHPRHVPGSQRLPEITGIINQFGLQLNPIKTKEYDLAKPCAIEYLGYVFRRDKTSTDVRLSEKKLNKYHDRLTACFKAYAKEKRTDSKSAYRNLVARVRFLSGNTQLDNAKSNAHTGIFFSNPGLTILDQLDELDLRLALLAWKYLSDRSSLKRSILSLSFRDGYERKRIFRFNRRRRPGHIHEMHKIVGAWSYAEKA